jgi:hypothetical protein
MQQYLKKSISSRSFFYGKRRTFGVDAPPPVLVAREFLSPTGLAMPAFPLDLRVLKRT